MQNNICIFDLDNTLYDFIDFFGPAFRGMVSAISKSTNIDIETLTREAAFVLSKHNFLEYPFLIREMRVFSLYSQEEIERLEKLAASVFGRVRQSRLVLYPEMNETIIELHDGGVEIVAVTNAPLFQSYRRLESLNLLKYFSAIVAINNIEIPEYIRLKSKNREPWKSKKNLKVLTFDRSKAKPSDYPYKIIQEYMGKQKQYWVIGDNIGRDLAPASKLGFKTIWAKYGCDIDEKNYKTVLDLTPHSVKKHEVAKSEYVPDFIIQTPKELLEIIPYRRQLSMFDFIDRDEE